MKFFSPLWIVLLVHCDGFPLINPLHPSIHGWSLNALDATSASEGGLYRSFAELAWDILLEQQPSLLAAIDLPTELSHQETTVPPHHQTVRISLRAAAGTDAASPIQYVRSALIETLGANGSDGETEGIQVLNMVIFPRAHTGLPVWGADFVSLPGNKHLLLLDAQPVRAFEEDGNASGPQKDEAWFHSWYERHEIATRFPWGGDLPEAVQEFVSSRALWTRLGTVPNAAHATQPEGDDPSTTSPIRLIQESLFPAALDHLSTYLQWLRHDPVVDDARRVSLAAPSRLPRYLQYRLDNDPARPMLKRLFGPEWTEQALHEVLFPMHQVLPTMMEKQ
jgi:Ferredoxin-dependent bilin reductase